MASATKSRDLADPAMNQAWRVGWKEKCKGEPTG
jgi:hypothetical protein